MFNWENEEVNVGSLYAITLKDKYLRKSNGSIKTWTTEKSAKSAAKKVDGKVTSLSLTKTVSYKPEPKDSSEVLSFLDTIRPYFESGIARTAIFDYGLDSQTNILRWAPLVSGQLHTRPVKQVGDEDTIVDLRLKFYADTASMRAITK